MRFNVNAYVADGKMQASSGSVIVNACPEHGGRPSLTFYIVVILFALCSLTQASEFHAGPLFDRFSLTLATGTRTEVLGPLFYSQQKEGEQNESEHIWAFPPVLSYTREPSIAFSELDFCYPL